MYFHFIKSKLRNLTFSILKRGGRMDRGRMDIVVGNGPEEEFKSYSASTFVEVMNPINLLVG